MVLGFQVPQSPEKESRALVTRDWRPKILLRRSEMPTYQYECSACNHTFEILQSFNDKKLRKCPECGKLKLHRLIGAGGGIIFKGSGFYETDYKRKAAPVEETNTDSVAKDTSKSDVDKKEKKTGQEAKMEGKTQKPDQ